MRLRTAGLLLLALVSLALGAFAADPFGTVQAVQRARLEEAGARVETFRGDDGTRLSVFELGPLSAERPVVLLHGLGADATYWTSTARFLAKRGRTVLLPDAPGSGKSQQPPSAEGYGLEARVAAVDALARALGLDRFDLVGHSLGGWTAGAYALRHPHRVANLVLSDSGGFTFIPESERAAARDALSPGERRAARGLVDLLFARPPFPIPGFVVDSFGRNYRAPNVVGTLTALRDEDTLLGREHELPHGTVLLWGEKDKIFPLKDARGAAAKVAGSRLLVITGAGHDPALEMPARFDETLLSALAGRAPLSR